MTLSGGEPAVQFDFSLALMRRLRQEGVHLALDTCGSVAPERLWELASLADLVLYDLKTMDPALHREYTGVELDRVLANAERLAAEGKPMWVRTPVIPGYTDSGGERPGRRPLHRGKAAQRGALRPAGLQQHLRGQVRAPGSRFRLADEGLLAGEWMERLHAGALEEGVACASWSGTTARAKEREVERWSSAQVSDIFAEGMIAKFLATVDPTGSRTWR